MRLCGKDAALTTQSFSFGGQRRRYMRTDVKIGIGLSMALVLVVGGYFTFRGGGEKPIQVADQATPANPSTLKSAGKDTVAKEAKPAQPRQPLNPATRSPRIGPSSADTRLAQNDKAAGNTNPSPAAVERSASPVTPPGGPDASTSSSPAPVNETGTVAASPDGSAASPVGTQIPPASTRTDVPGGPGFSIPAATALNPQPTTNPTTGTSPREVDHAAVDIHRAQPGDTLISIAQAYYGSATFVPLLRQANPDVTDPTRLTPGTAIRIPPAPLRSSRAASAPSTARTAAPGQPTSTGATPAGGGKRTYTVQSGDSFYRIAERQLGNANRWRELLQLNSALVNGDPTRLRPGQVVVLP
jgi:nucleoid-associated protein YgaU